MEAFVLAWVNGWVEEVQYEGEGREKEEGYGLAMLQVRVGGYRENRERCEGKRYNLGSEGEERETEKDFGLAVLQERVDGQNRNREKGDKVQVFPFGSPRLRISTVRQRVSIPSTPKLVETKRLPLSKGRKGKNVHRSPPKTMRTAWSMVWVGLSLNGCDEMKRDNGEKF